MTREQVIRHLCTTVALVYRSVNDYTEPSDGFCQRCRVENSNLGEFRHSGRTLRYVRQAVVEKLQEDGYKLAFDPKEEEA